MDKPILPNLYTTPLYTQHYERYLPTAFDESLTLLQKVNKVIVKLDQLGKLSNDTMEQWNTVMDWVMNDGLNGSIEDKLNAMLADGTLEGIINTTLFNDLDTRVTANETSIASLNTLTNAINTTVNSLSASVTVNTSSIATNTANIATNTNNIKWIGVSVKSLGAKGDYVSDLSRGTDDTSIFQGALNNGGIIFIPKGSYYITQPLSVKSDTRVIFSPDAVLHTYGLYAFTFEAGTEQVRMEQPRVINHNSNVTYAFNLNGNNTGGYSTAVKNIIIEQGYAEGYTWAFYMKSARKCSIRDFLGWTRNGVQYIGVTAENVIVDSNFTQYDEANLSGTKGLYSLANSEGNPEGLTVSNTLFYHFERNIHITDLFVGFFTKLYLDAGITGCLENMISYHTNTSQLHFTDIWALRKGFVLGGEAYSSPKEFRSKFSNISLDGLDGEGFHLDTWVREIEINNLAIYGIGAQTSIGIVGWGQNDFLKINGYRGRFMQSNIQLNGAGQTNLQELSNISNYDGLGATLHIYTQHDITLNHANFPANG